ACLGLLAAARGPAQGQFGRTPDAPGRGAAAGMPPFSLAELPAGVQEGARAVLEKPTLTARGPGERFACRPATYRWLLEHPGGAPSGPLPVAHRQPIADPGGAPAGGHGAAAGGAVPGPVAAVLRRIGLAPGPGHGAGAGDVPQGGRAVPLAGEPVSGRKL